MNLSPWTDVPFKDEDAIQDFLLANGLTLDRIVSVMRAQSLPVNVYPLYDPPSVDGDWLLNIQSELESIYARLNLTGLPDLSSADWDKEDEFNDWMLSYRQVIERLNATLGIF